MTGTAAMALALAPLAARAAPQAPQSQSGKVAVVTGDPRVDKLLSEMTLDQKLTLLEGEAEVASSSDQYQAGYLPGIPSLGIPSLKLTDGPPGVITKQNSTGMTATMGVAATFSQSDAEANGVVIGRDAKALGMDVVLQPFVNMGRDTSWARGFNTFGEDPLLTGQSGADEITGIQSQGEMAMVKHYIAYDGSNNVDVDQQTLHEIYLEPFTDAVNAGVSSAMCSYNIINKAQSCGNSQTLTQILRNELGFKGFVTSDWGANHATSYINAGLDMEMPGGGGPSGVGFPSYFSKAALTAAIKAGSVKVARVTQAAGRILYEYDRFGLLSGASKHTVTPEPTATDEQVVQQTGEDAATLLKNTSSALPLSGSALSSLALIGPTAGQTDATDGGGEKSGGIVSQQVGTVSALKEEDPGANITYAVGDDMTGTPVPAADLSHSGKPGLVLTNTKTGATKVAAQVDSTTSAHTALPAGSTYKWAGTLTAPAAGSYWLNIQSLGATATLTVDGKALTTVGGGFSTSPRYGTVHATDGNGPLPTTDGLANGRTLISLKAGKHTLSVTESPDASGSPVQVRLNWVTPTQQQANTSAAVTAAKNAKVAVVFAWAPAGDDLSTPLPENQDQLIEKVASVNPDTIVVLNTSEPVAMPWLSKVKSVLEMWYPGDRGGYATASVLLGTTDPAGKLPFTWPASISQEVAHQAAHPERTSTGVNATGKLCTAAEASATGSTCKTTYSEGLNIGYRFFDATGETPLYPFGYGLSYTSFSYSGLREKPARNGDLTVSFTVANTGSVAGAAIPQVYLGAPAHQPSGVQFAPRALAGYTRVSLDPGQSTTVRITVPKRQLQYWSTAKSSWVTATGTRTLYVSSDERTNVLQAGINVR
ncbi:MAG: beta-glucosidase family protein [Trebonia sp.]